jgi:hypothetical protein
MLTSNPISECSGTPGGSGLLAIHNAPAVRYAGTDNTAAAIPQQTLLRVTVRIVNSRSKPTFIPNDFKSLKTRPGLDELNSAIFGFQILG